MNVEQTHRGIGSLCSNLFFFFCLDFMHGLHLFMFADRLENPNSKSRSHAATSTNILLDAFVAQSKIVLAMLTVDDLDWDDEVEIKQRKKLVFEHVLAAAQTRPRLPVREALTVPDCCTRGDIFFFQSPLFLKSASFSSSSSLKVSLSRQT